MGHPISDSISTQLSVPPQSFPIFSPLLSQSSKLLTGVVSSLLSPWAMAPRENTDESDPNHEKEASLRDASSGDSLINAFQKIAVADAKSESDDGKSVYL